MVKYSSFGISLQGASHAKKGLPNQDSFAKYVSPDEDFAIITVCDGHGGEKYIRSAKGAEIAAEQITALMKDFLEKCNLEKIKITDELEKLKRNIISYWREEVSKHLEKEPITEDDFQSIVSDAIRENNILAYGTTAITVGITQEYVLCIQIGDGDITFLMEDGGKLINPLKNDKRLIANETTSLCGDMAIHDFRQYLSKELPVAVTACTDGISNSYIESDDFRQLTKDINDELHEKGEKKTIALLEEGLERVSKKGSGDDVTLAMIYGKRK